MVGPTRFRMLNREGEVEIPDDWNDSDKPKLWLYHLHFFDDLNARGSEGRRGWHRELILKWIEDNPPGEGVGWEPYPTSLRIVNWIKWSLREAPSSLPDSALCSLAIQVRWLERRLERHLLGNHLLANAKALTFAGLFFAGREAGRWHGKGWELLQRELHEQILADGGHFERSPAYHSIVFEDLLDLIGLHYCYGREVPDTWVQMATSMQRWLDVMCHPDGEIAFFNDAAVGMAPSPKRLSAYAERLEVPRPTSGRRGSVEDLSESGFVRVETSRAVAHLDLGPVGPDYLPAHAHADTLCFEASVGGRRLFVNCGTSRYESGERRLWERSTAAHNTVEVDGENSSEVWGAFRVARRARVSERVVEESGDTVHVVGQHDGYGRLDGHPIHRREWWFDEGEMTIVDRIDGGGTHGADFRLHVHPRWRVAPTGDGQVSLSARDGTDVCEVQFDGPGHLTIDDNCYGPEFGRLEPIETLRYTVGPSSLPIVICTHVSWRPTGGSKDSR